MKTMPSTPSGKYMEVYARTTWNDNLLVRKSSDKALPTLKLTPKYVKTCKSFHISVNISRTLTTNHDTLLSYCVHRMGYKSNRILNHMKYGCKSWAAGQDNFKQDWRSYRSSNCESPFSLVYGSDPIIPAYVKIPTLLCVVTQKTLIQQEV